MNRITAAFALVLLAACARSEDAVLLPLDNNQAEAAVETVRPDRDDQELALGAWRETLQDEQRALEFGPTGAPPHVQPALRRAPNAAATPRPRFRGRAAGDAGLGRRRIPAARGHRHERRQSDAPRDAGGKRHAAHRFGPGDGAHFHPGRRFPTAEPAAQPADRGLCRAMRQRRNAATRGRGQQRCARRQCRGGDRRLMRLLSAALLAAMASACVPRQAPPLPAPAPPPRPIPPPAPEPQLPAPVPVDWMDAPLTPGDWRLAEVLTNAHGHLRHGQRHRVPDHLFPAGASRAVGARRARKRNDHSYDIRRTNAFDARRSPPPIHCWSRSRSAGAGSSSERLARPIASFPAGQSRRGSLRRVAANKKAPLPGAAKHGILTEKNSRSRLDRGFCANSYKGQVQHKRKEVIRCLMVQQRGRSSPFGG